MPKGPSIPDFYKCANCGHSMEVEGYMMRPDSQVPDDRIHEVTESGIIPFSLGCTCGHFTVVRLWRSPE